jgi:hypothetical protein
MSVCDIQQIAKRLKDCSPESPIVIFKLPGNQDGHYEALFLNTVETKRRIKRKPNDLIGVYDKNTDLKFLRNKLAKIILEETQYEVTTINQK